MRKENFCYFHHTTRLPAPNAKRPGTLVGSTFEIPLPENREAIQYTIGEILRRLASDNIDFKQASLMLYGLSLASNNLPRESKTAPKPAAEPALQLPPEILDEPVLEVVIDPEVGVLAPSDEPLVPGQKLISPAQGRIEAEEARKRAAQKEAERLYAAADAAQAAKPPIVPRPPGVVTPELLRLRTLYPKMNFK